MPRHGSDADARQEPTAVGLEAAQPKHFLQACLLLFLREGPAHGYALLERLDELGRPSDRGVVYRTLRSLEREDLVDSTWEPSASGPSRRSYRLTARGDEMLKAWASAVEDCSRLLDDFLHRYHDVTTG